MNGRQFGLLLAILVAVGAALAIAVSCPRPATTGTPYAEFAAHRVLWARQRPSNYTVDIQKRCFCPTWSVRVMVTAAGLQSLKFMNDPRDRSVYADHGRYPHDIDEVFDLVEAAYSTRAYKIDLTFDDVYGYPASVFIDRDLNTSDDEQSIKLSAFEPGKSVN